jgi:NOL1/NOP2/sun family putative RNA methylase
MINLPIDFEKRMREILGEEFEDYKSELENPSSRAFRVNTNKISLEDFEKLNPFGSEKIPYVENGFYFQYERIGNHPYHHAGFIYVQEPAAMAPAECIDINPDWCVLDMCAAPGGKSTQIANKLGENGVLVSNEIIPSRCKILSGNVERLGLENVVVTCTDTAFLAKTFPKAFDLIMVDAPCSGEGMFRKEEAAVNEWSRENVLKCAKRQGEILENAAKLLKDGGTVVYATCTFSLEENEMIVDAFLSAHDEFELVPPKQAVIDATVDGIKFDGCKCQNINFARRFYPHKNRGEGQFMAVLKNKNNATQTFSAKKNAKTEKEVVDFLKENLNNFDESKVQMVNGTPVYFTSDFDLKGIKPFLCGVTIGEIRKNYIQPHHQLFTALGDKFKRKIELDLNDERVLKYLRGEEIEARSENGFAAVMVDGVALGGAKVSNGIAKNHYPKGLRLKI